MWRRDWRGNKDSLVPRQSTPQLFIALCIKAFIHSAIKSWGVESGNEAKQRYLEEGERGIENGGRIVRWQVDQILKQCNSIHVYTLS